MTIITVISPGKRLHIDQRRQLAETLTDAILIPEIGQFVEAARAGFQVHFCEFSPSHIAINGKLLVDQAKDVIVVDIAVMDGDWPQDVRNSVIDNVFKALTVACQMTTPSPTWWINFRVIDEGSWGSRGGVLSIHDILSSGVFSDKKFKAISRSVKAIKLKE